MQKKIITITLLSLISTALYAGQSVQADHSNINVSFVQNADTAQLSVLNEKNKTYTLVLKGIKPELSYLSDRPNRVLGEVSNQDFLTQWTSGKNSFNNDAPNAVLTGTSQHQSETVALELSQPVVNDAEQTFTYQVKLLQPNAPTNFTLTNVAMFIDDACLTCIGDKAFVGHASHAKQHVKRQGGRGRSRR